VFINCNQAFKKKSGSLPLDPVRVSITFNVYIDLPMIILIESLILALHSFFALVPSVDLSIGFYAGFRMLLGFVWDLLNAAFPCRCLFSYA
jgi:hypothetical protein